MRLLIDVVEAVSDVWGQDRVGVLLSPLGTFNKMGDDEPEATFSTIAKTLGDHSLAYLHIINPAIVGAIEKGIEPDPGALCELIGRFKIFRPDARHLCDPPILIDFHEPDDSCLPSQTGCFACRICRRQILANAQEMEVAPVVEDYGGLFSDT
jgi:hypothetical protein